MWRHVITHIRPTAVSCWFLFASTGLKKKTMHPPRWMLFAVFEDARARNRSGSVSHFCPVYWHPSVSAYWQGAGLQEVACKDDPLKGATLCQVSLDLYPSEPSQHSCSASEIKPVLEHYLSVAQYAYCILNKQDVCWQSQWESFLHFWMRDGIGPIRGVSNESHVKLQKCNCYGSLL